jgi:restriction system protein
MREPSFREFYRKEGQEVSREPSSQPIEPAASTTTPEERIDAAYQSLDAALRADLLERIVQNSPAFFEQLIVDVLVAMGYGGSQKNAAARLGRSGDGGVDV